MPPLGLHLQLLVRRQFTLHRLLAMQRQAAGVQAGAAVAGAAEAAVADRHLCLAVPLALQLAHPLELGQAGEHPAPGLPPPPHPQWLLVAEPKGLVVASRQLEPART